MNNKVPLTWHRWNSETGDLSISVSMTMRSDLDNVFEVYWNEEPIK